MKNDDLSLLRKLSELSSVLQKEPNEETTQQLINLFKPQEQQPPIEQRPVEPTPEEQAINQLREDYAQNPEDVKNYILFTRGLKNLDEVDERLKGQDELQTLTNIALNVPKQREYYKDLGVLGSFVSGAKRNIEQLKSIPDVVGSFFGSKKASEGLLQSIKKQEEIPSAKLSFFDDVLKNPETLPYYLAENLGQMSPETLLTILASVGGGVAGSALGGGINPVTGAAGAVAGKGLVSFLKNRILDKAKQTVAEQASKGLLTNVGKNVLEKEIKRQSAKIGAMTAGGATATLTGFQHLGQSEMEGTGQVTGKSALLAPIYGAIEMLSLGELAKTVGLGRYASAISNVFDNTKVSVDLTKPPASLLGKTANFAKGFGRVGFVEGVMEEIPQTAMERYVADKPLTSDDALREYAESAVGGFLTGGLLHGAGSFATGLPKKFATEYNTHFNDYNIISQQLTDTNYLLNTHEGRNVLQTLGIDVQSLDNLPDTPNKLSFAQTVKTRDEKLLELLHTPNPQTGQPPINKLAEMTAEAILLSGISLPQAHKELTTLLSELNAPSDLTVPKFFGNIPLKNLSIGQVAAVRKKLLKPYDDTGLTNTNTLANVVSETAFKENIPLQDAFNKIAPYISDKQRQNVLNVLQNNFVDLNTIPTIDNVNSVLLGNSYQRTQQVLDDTYFATEKKKELLDKVITFVQNLPNSAQNKDALYSEINDFITEIQQHPDLYQTLLKTNTPDNQILIEFLQEAPKGFTNKSKTISLVNNYIKNTFSQQFTQQSQQKATSQTTNNQLYSITPTPFTTQPLTYRQGNAVEKIPLSNVILPYSVPREKSLVPLKEEKGEVPAVIPKTTGETLPTVQNKQANALRKKILQYKTLTTPSTPIELSGEVYDKKTLASIKQKLKAQQTEIAQKTTQVEPALEQEQTNQQQIIDKEQTKTSKKLQTKPIQKTIIEKSETKISQKTQVEKPKQTTTTIKQIEEKPQEVKQGEEKSQEVKLKDTEKQEPKTTPPVEEKSIEGKKKSVTKKEKPVTQQQVQEKVTEEKQTAPKAQSKPILLEQTEKENITEEPKAKKIKITKKGVVVSTEEKTEVQSSADILLSKADDLINQDLNQVNDKDLDDFVVYIKPPQQQSIADSFPVKKSTSAVEFVSKLLDFILNVPQSSNYAKLQNYFLTNVNTYFQRDASDIQKKAWKLYIIKNKGFKNAIKNQLLASIFPQIEIQETNVIAPIFGQLIKNLTKPTKEGGSILGNIIDKFKEKYIKDNDIIILLNRIKTQLHSIVVFDNKERWEKAAQNVYEKYLPNNYYKNPVVLRGLENLDTEEALLQSSRYLTLKELLTNWEEHLPVIKDLLQNKSQDLDTVLGGIYINDKANKYNYGLTISEVEELLKDKLNIKILNQTNLQKALDAYVSERSNLTTNTEVNEVLEAVALTKRYFNNLIKEEYYWKNFSENILTTFFKALHKKALKNNEYVIAYKTLEKFAEKFNTIEKADTLIANYLVNGLSAFNFKLNDIYPSLEKITTILDEELNKLNKIYNNTIIEELNGLFGLAKETNKITPEIFYSVLEKYNNIIKETTHLSELEEILYNNIDDFIKSDLNEDFLSDYDNFTAQQIKKDLETATTVEKLQLIREKYGITEDLDNLENLTDIDIWFYKLQSIYNWASKTPFDKTKTVTHSGDYAKQLQTLQSLLMQIVEYKELSKKYAEQKTQINLDVPPVILRLSDLMAGVEKHNVSLETPIYKIMPLIEVLNFVSGKELFDLVTKKVADLKSEQLKQQENITKFGNNLKFLSNIHLMTNLFIREKYGELTTSKKEPKHFFFSYIKEIPYEGVYFSNNKLNKVTGTMSSKEVMTKPFTLLGINLTDLVDEYNYEVLTSLKDIVKESDLIVSTVPEKIVDLLRGSIYNALLSTVNKLSKTMEESKQQIKDINAQSLTPNPFQMSLSKGQTPTKNTIYNTKLYEQWGLSYPVLYQLSNLLFIPQTDKFISIDLSNGNKLNIPTETTGFSIKKDQDKYIIEYKFLKTKLTISVNNKDDLVSALLKMIISPSLSSDYTHLFFTQQTLLKELNELLTPVNNNSVKLNVSYIKNGNTINTTIDIPEETDIYQILEIKDNKIKFKHKYDGSEKTINTNDFIKFLIQNHLYDLTPEQIDTLDFIYKSKVNILEYNQLYYYTYLGKQTTAIKEAYKNFNHGELLDLILNGTLVNGLTLQKTKENVHKHILVNIQYLWEHFLATKPEKQDLETFLTNTKLAVNEAKGKGEFSLKELINSVVNGLGNEFPTLVKIIDKNSHYNLTKSLSSGVVSLKDVIDFLYGILTDYASALFNLKNNEKTASVAEDRMRALDEAFFTLFKNISQVISINRSSISSSKLIKTFTKKLQTTNLTEPQKLVLSSLIAHINKKDDLFDIIDVKEFGQNFAYDYFLNNLKIDLTQPDADVNFLKALAHYAYFNILSEHDRLNYANLYLHNPISNIVNKFFVQPFIPSTNISFINTFAENFVLWTTQGFVENFEYEGFLNKLFRNVWNKLIQFLSFLKNTVSISNVYYSLIKNDDLLNQIFSKVINQDGLFAEIKLKKDTIQNFQEEDLLNIDDLMAYKNTITNTELANLIKTTTDFNLIEKQIYQELRYKYTDINKLSKPTIELLKKLDLYDRVTFLQKALQFRPVGYSPIKMSSFLRLVFIDVPDDIKETFFDVLDTAISSNLFKTYISNHIFLFKPQQVHSIFNLFKPIYIQKYGEKQGKELFEKHYIYIYNNTITLAINKAKQNNLYGKLTKPQLIKNILDNSNLTNNQKIIFASFVDNISKKEDLFKLVISNTAHIGAYGVNTNNLYISPLILSDFNTGNLTHDNSSFIFLHELGHFGFYSMLSIEDQINILWEIGDDIIKKPTARFVAEKDLHYAKGTELFAEYFAIWVIDKTTEKPALKPFFEKIWKLFTDFINAIKTTFGLANTVTKKEIIEPLFSEKYFEKILDINNPKFEKSFEKYANLVNKLQTNKKSVDIDKETSLGSFPSGNSQYDKTSELLKQLYYDPSSFNTSQTKYTIQKYLKKHFSNEDIDNINNIIKEIFSMYNNWSDAVKKLNEAHSKKIENLQYLLSTESLDKEKTVKAYLALLMFFNQSAPYFVKKYGAQQGKQKFKDLYVKILQKFFELKKFTHKEIKLAKTELINNIISNADLTENQKIVLASFVYALNSEDNLFDLSFIEDSSEAGGWYTLGNKIILNTFYSVPNFKTVFPTFEHTFLHEIGHYGFLSILNPEEQAEALWIIGRRRKIEQMPFVRILERDEFNIPKSKASYFVSGFEFFAEGFADWAMQNTVPYNDLLKFFSDIKKVFLQFIEKIVTIFPIFNEYFEAYYKEQPLNQFFTKILDLKQIHPSFLKMEKMQSSFTSVRKNTTSLNELKNLVDSAFASYNNQNPIDKISPAKLYNTWSDILEKRFTALKNIFKPKSADLQKLQSQRDKDISILSKMFATPFMQKHPQIKEAFYAQLSKQAYLNKLLYNSEINPKTNKHWSFFDLTPEENTELERIAFACDKYKINFQNNPTDKNEFFALIQNPNVNKERVWKAFLDWDEANRINGSFLINEFINLIPRLWENTNWMKTLEEDFNNLIQEAKNTQLYTNNRLPSKTLKDFYDRVKQENLQEYLPEIKAAISLALGITAKLTSKLQKVLDKNAFYYPRLRLHGNYALRGTKFDPTTNEEQLVYLEFFNTPEDAVAQKEKLEKDNPDKINYIVEREPKQKEILLEKQFDKFLDLLQLKAHHLGTQLSLTETEIDNLLKGIENTIDLVFKIESPNIISFKEKSNYFNLINQQLQGNIGKHGIPRVKQYVAGYQRLVPAVLYKNYILTTSNLLTKVRLALDLKQIITTAQQDPQAYRVVDYIKKYAENMLEHSTDMDKLFSKIKSFIFFYYLGFKLSTAFLQFTQNYVLGVPLLYNFAKKFKIKPDFGELFILYSKTLAEDPEQYTGVLKQLVDLAKAEGHLTAMEIQFLSNEFGTSGDWFQQNIVEKSGFFFRTVEKMNRKAAFVTAVKLLLKYRPNLTLDEIYKEAVDYMYLVHIPLGKANLPEFARGNTIASRLLGLFYTFMSYPHHFWQILINAVKNKDFALIARIFFATLLLGGLAGEPLIDGIATLLTKMFGIDFRGEALRALRKVNPEIADVVIFGVPALAGISLSGAVRTDAPVLQEVFSQKGEPVGLIESSLLGVYYNLLQSVIKSTHLVRQERYGRALEEISPIAIKNIIKSIREFSEGVTTSIYRTPVTDVATLKQLKLNQYEAVAQSLGFSPLSKTIAYTAREGKQLTQNHYALLRKTISNEYKINEENKTKEGYLKRKLELLQKIKEYNQMDDVKNGLMPKLKVSEIRQSMRQKPSLTKQTRDKKEKKFLQKYYQ